MMLIIRAVALAVAATLATCPVAEGAVELPRKKKRSGGSGGGNGSDNGNNNHHNDKKDKKDKNDKHRAAPKERSVDRIRL